MKHLTRFSTLLLLLTLTLLLANGETHFFTQEQISSVRMNGIEFKEKGNYSIWAWSKDTESLTIALDTKEFTYSPDPKVKKDYFSWKKIGEFQSVENQKSPIDFYSDKKGMVLKPGTLGWLAISNDPTYNPEEFFTLSRVFDHTADESKDQRLTDIRKIDSYYTMPEYKSKEEWLKRKEELRQHILTSTGLLPEPPKCPLNPHVFDKIEFDDYTIEKVYFESLPGFYVTGNLYRPKGKQGPFPAILNVHGHWKEGRLVNSEENSIPTRCMNFAKQGYIALAIDMIGYNDSKQLTHKFGGKEESLWGLSLHGLQLWNSIRAIDFLSQLDGVDPLRIGCTGASGGGTQTYTLAAVDERVQYAAPVNMLSAQYQGGCLCENCPNLRIDAFNLEFGAMMAPRYLMMIACTGDWTKDTPYIEFPAIKSVYDLFTDKNHACASSPFVDFKQFTAQHNYNKDSREAVYTAFGKCILGNNNKEDFKEKPLNINDLEKLRVFPDKLPAEAKEEKEIVKEWKDMSQKQWEIHNPATPLQIKQVQKKAQSILEHTLNVQQPSLNDLSIHRVSATTTKNLHIEKLLIGRKNTGEQIPVLVIRPAELETITHPIDILLHDQGHAAFFNPQTGKPGPILQSLINDKHLVIMPDLWLTGEYNTPFNKANREPAKPADHFNAYNQTDTALRIQDILTSITFAQMRSNNPQNRIIAEGESGLWAMLAATQTNRISLIADAAGFDTSNDQEYLDKLFIPGLRSAGGFNTALSLLPSSAFIHNTQGKFKTGWASITSGQFKSKESHATDEEIVSSGKNE